MKTLLVTGVPGWLTNVLLASLATSPLPGLEEVRCLMLRPGGLPVRPPPGLRFVPVVGELSDQPALIKAVTGCDAVLHAAGILHVHRTADWYRINTQGTANLVAASCQAGVKRFVLISSNAAAGKSPDKSRLMAESDPARPLSHYGRSKLLAERLVLDAPLEGVVLRPCMFYGPPVPARHIAVYQRILRGRMPLIGGGDYARSITHVENLVQGCRLALTQTAAARQTYYIADAEVYTTKSIIEAMGLALGAPPRYLRLPGLLAPLACSGDRMLAALGIYWQSLHLVGEADWHVGVSIAKARRELNYQPRHELKQGMQLAIQWCRDQGLLPPLAK